MKKSAEKTNNKFFKTVIFILIFTGISAYAFYFPATMTLIDKNINRIFEKTEFKINSSLFSDYSEFVRKTVNGIIYTAETVIDNINHEDEIKAVTAFLTSCSARFPSESRNITSCFGNREDPFTGLSDSHSGIDIAAPEGSSVTAAWPGVIYETGFDDTYGNFVVIKHDEDFFTKYCHLSKITVSESDFVNAGEKIGEAGNTGRSTGSHLHFEIIINGIKIDPMECLDI